MNSSLRAKFERRVPVVDIDRARSGSPARYALAAQNLTQTVTAAEALAYRHLSLLQAKRTVEALLDGQTVWVELPMLEDAAAFEAQMAALGITALRRELPGPVDVRALRERFGLTPDLFATRFGLDVATVKAWEDGSVQPDPAARTLLLTIAADPAAVDRALSAAA